MAIARTLRHLFATRAGTRRRFTDAVDASIESAIRAAETRTSGEIRFVIETALDLPELWAGVTPRERALQVFSQLRVWDTELRNGVLIYVLAADRDVEIVADRGAAARISPDRVGIRVQAHRRPLPCRPFPGRRRRGSRRRWADC